MDRINQNATNIETDIKIDENNNISSFNSQNDINLLFKQKEKFSEEIINNITFKKPNSRGIQALNDSMKSSQSPNSKINNNRSGKCKIV